MRIKILLLLTFFIFSFVETNAQNARKYTTYVVKPGESLRSIAKKVGCRYKEIKNLNPDVDKKHPRVNTTLVIPNKNYGKPKEKKVAPTKGITIHIVKEGNTLFGIAKQYNVTLQSLIEANPYAAKGLQPGQKIRIPSIEEFTVKDENEKVVFYKVQKGDTKWRIATIHHISVDDLDKLNPDHIGELKENENILVPAKKEVAKEV
jgi:LysM repeat protein